LPSHFNWSSAASRTITYDPVSWRRNRFMSIMLLPGKINSVIGSSFGRLRGTVSTAEYLISETDRLVASVLDALEVVSAENRSADGNHIFMYNLAVEYEDVIAAISRFIERHGKRLWRLYMTGSEIRIALEEQ
jgi:Acetyl-CoA carboxylase, central region